MNLKKEKTMQWNSNKKKLFLAGIILLLIITILLSSKPIQTAKENKEPESKITTGILEGNLAPDFELNDLKGKKVKLSDFKGKNIILNFWATWCPFCVHEMPLFQKKFEETENLVVIGVNLQEKPETIKSFAEKLEITYPLLLDPEKRVKKQYNVYMQPVTYIINSKRIIIARKFGPITETELNQKLDALKN